MRDGWGMFVPWDGWSVYVERAAEEELTFSTPVSWAGESVADGTVTITLRLTRR